MNRHSSRVQNRFDVFIPHKYIFTEMLERSIMFLEWKDLKLRS